MNRTSTFKKIILIAITGFLSSTAMAQLDDTKVFTRAAEDASVITGAYVSPLLNGFGTGLNNGWFNTANVHKTGRFDLTVSFTGVFVPMADRNYDASKLNLQVVRPGKTGNTIAPTILGENEEKVNFYKVYTKNTFTPDPNDEVAVDSFNAPAGINFGTVPVPVAHLSIGIIKGTEISIRYIPTFGSSDVGAKIGLFGFGAKHDIKQWIPVMKELPFDLSAQAAYSKLTASVALDANDPSKEMTLKTNAYNLNLIVSKKIAVITGYAGLGYQGASSNVAIKGNYEVKSVDPNTGTPTTRTIKDPVDFTASGANGLKGTVGVRLKLLVLTIHADYSISKYSSATAGLGICVDFL